MSFNWGRRRSIPSLGDPRTDIPARPLESLNERLIPVDLNLFLDDDFFNLLLIDPIVTSDIDLPGKRCAFFRDIVG